MLKVALYVAMAAALLILIGLMGEQDRQDEAMKRPITTEEGR